MLRRDFKTIVPAGRWEGPGRDDLLTRTLDSRGRAPWITAESLRIYFGVFLIRSRSRVVKLEVGKQHLDLLPFAPGREIGMVSEARERRPGQ